MSMYTEASKFKEILKLIVDEEINNHPLVKSSIKVQKATIISVDLEKQSATIQFPFDSTLVTLPFNPIMTNFLSGNDVKGKIVSVWYYQSLQNGIIMQDAYWSI